MNWIKSKIVTLPTKDEAHVGIYTGGTNPIYTPMFPPSYWDLSKIVYQHLYFTSDEEIKEGDWYIHTGVTHNERKTYHNLYLSYKGTRKIEGKDNVFVDGMFVNDCKKIIATTDKSLGLSQIPQDFIKEYCDAGGIDEVMVELEEFRIKKECGCKGMYYRCGCKDEYKNQIKTNPDNTINIRRIKDSWSREEVVALIKKSKIDFPLHRGIQLLEGELNKWIEKNL
jgi:hypothetical protein